MPVSSLITTVCVPANTLGALVSKVRITSDDQVKVTLSLANALTLATGETLQVSANGTDWVVTTDSNKAWATADDAVTLVAGTGKTLTARVIDIAGNITALTLSGNGYTLDTSAPSVLAGTHTVTISDDTGIDGDRITSDDQVKESEFYLCLQLK
jgi:hypothetical protein